MARTGPKPKKPIRTFEHRNGVVTRVFSTWVETLVPGLPPISAVPEKTAAQARSAARLGYGGDVDHMTRDHDLLHNLVADMLAMPSSFSIRVAAGRATARDREFAALEEEAVMALQAFVRKAGIDLLALPKG